MTIKTGDTIPNATLLRMGADGPEGVELSTLTNGRNVVIFGLPGAFTGTCTTAHLPSFMRTKPQFDAKGVDEVICIAVNDPFVMDAWGKSTGADAAGVRLLGDSDASFTKAIGMAFTAPPAGFYDRAQRYAMYVEDNVVKVLNQEEKAGACELTVGENLLDAMG